MVCQKKKNCIGKTVGFSTITNWEMNRWKNKSLSILLGIRKRCGKWKPPNYFLIDLLKFNLSQIFWAIKWRDAWRKLMKKIQFGKWKSLRRENSHKPNFWYALRLPSLFSSSISNNRKWNASMHEARALREKYKSLIETIV